MSVSTRLKLARKALHLTLSEVQIKTGVDALERGDFTEIEAADLDSFLEGLTATARPGAR